jgi:hypothetical protein
MLRAIRKLKSQEEQKSEQDPGSRRIGNSSFKINISQDQEVSGERDHSKVE